jgi:hypothetical protein
VRKKLPARKLIKRNRTMESVKGSTAAYGSELDLSTLPPSDVGINYSEYHTYFPVFNTKEWGNPVQFIIPQNQSLYADLTSSFVYLKLRILKQDDSALSSTDLVAPTHNMFRALFSSCEIMMNSTVVSTSSNLYAYKSHIIDTLRHGSSFQSSQLSRQLFDPDTKQNDFTTSNPAFVRRTNISKLSTPFELIGKISESVFETPRFFPPEVETRITLRRSDPSFCLDSASPQNKPSPFPYKIVFDDCVLYVRKYSVNPQVVSHHHKILSAKGKFYYPLENFEIRSFNIASGAISLSSETLFRSIIPEYLIVTFVDSEAASGRINQSGFNFEPFKLKSLSVSVDNEATIYRQLDFNTDNSLALLGYNTLFTALSNPEFGISIKREDYLKGSFFVVLDLSPSSPGLSFKSVKRGQVHMELNFAEALQKTITCIVLGKFRSLLSIDSDKNVTVDSFGV